MTSFDSIASVYDQQFTDTKTGFLQRQLVYIHLEEFLVKHGSKRVLELNCGTGADAIWLAQKDCHVLATDISRLMIKAAQEKSLSLDEKTRNRLHFKTIAAEDIEQLSGQGPFDLIFSNFGGLNCVSPDDLRRLVDKLAKLLSPNGRLVFIIMGRFCPWESMYFLAKRNWKEAWRRQRKTAVNAPLGDGITIPTWYYSPKMMINIFRPSFQLKQQRAIGFFLPPSYLDPAFDHRPRALSLLWKAEKMCNEFEWLAAAGDHFLIEFERL